MRSNNFPVIASLLVFRVKKHRTRGYGASLLSPVAQERMIDLTMFLSDCHCGRDRNHTRILYLSNKEIITGETAANVRVHVPRIVIRIDRPRTGVHAIVPVPADINHPLVLLIRPPKIRPTSESFFTAVSWLLFERYFEPFALERRT